MKKNYAHIVGGGCNKLATCSLFHFPLREWPRSENHLEKYSFGAPFSPFFHFSFSSTSHRRNGKKTRAHRLRRLLQARHVFAFSFSITRVASFWKSHFFSISFFFCFEHFSPKKWKKNTRTSTVAAVTSSPRVRFHLLFVLKMSIYHILFPNCVCTRALHMCFHSYMCKDLARSSHTPQAMLAPRRYTLFLSFAAHSLHPPSSFLSCIGWLHGSHWGLAQRSHRRRGAPPGGRRGQGREEQGKRDWERLKGGMVAAPRGTLPLLTHEASALHVLCLGWGWGCFWKTNFFSFSSTSHRRNGKRTRAHQWWRL